MSTSPIPAFVTKYFWGDNLQELSLQSNRNYIVQTLLNLGDREALHWLFSNLEKQEVKQLVPTLKLDKKSANFWKLYLS
jgi:hypothetical protein